MGKPKKKYKVEHNGFEDEYYEWEQDEAENMYYHWKSFYDSNDKVVSFYEDGKLVKRTTFKVDVIEQTF